MGIFIPTAAPTHRPSKCVFAKETYHLIPARFDSLSVFQHYPMSIVVFYCNTLQVRSVFLDASPSRAVGIRHRPFKASRNTHAQNPHGLETWELSLS